MISNNQETSTLDILLNTLRLTGVLTEKFWSQLQIRIFHDFVIYSWGVDEYFCVDGDSYNFYFSFGEIRNDKYIMVFNCFLEDILNNLMLEKQFGDAIRKEASKYVGVNEISDDTSLTELPYNPLKAWVIEIPTSNAKAVLPELIMKLRTCLYDVRDKYYKSRGV